MSRRLRKFLDATCRVSVLSSTQVAGNQPKSRYRIIEKDFPCTLIKLNASTASTPIGQVPVTTYKVILLHDVIEHLPEGELKENDRIHLDKRIYTVVEVIPIKRKRRLHHLEVEVRRNN